MIVFCLSLFRKFRSRQKIYILLHLGVDLHHLFVVASVCVESGIARMCCRRQGKLLKLSFFASPRSGIRLHSLVQAVLSRSPVTPKASGIPPRNGDHPGELMQSKAVLGVFAKSQACAKTPNQRSKFFFVKREQRKYRRIADAARKSDPIRKKSRQKKRFASFIDEKNTVM